MTLWVLGSALLVLIPSREGMAASQTLWQIGAFDHSSEDLNQGWRDWFITGGAQPATTKPYVIGKSSSKADWQAYQPGSANEKAGGHPFPYTIEFNLAGPPKGTYSLRVSFISGGSPHVPTLQVEINGRQGWAYHHPQRHDGPGDKYWSDEVTLELPTTALKRGTNTLVLTAIDEPGAGSGSFLEYDALELDQDPAQAYAARKASVQFQPTIFYQQKEGQLVEQVDVYVHHRFPARDGRIVVTLGGRKFSADMVSRRAFGDEHVQLELPEFAAGAQADVAVTLGSHPQHLTATLTPARKWTLLVVPHEHVDVGYTDYQPKVSEIQSRVLDEAMDMVREHPDFRYSVDGYWVIQEFLAGRNAADRARLLEMVREHKIYGPAEYANLLTEFPALETLIRSLYPSYQFDRANGANFDYANITDVPSQSWAYASVLAAAGLKYFTSGSNPDRGPIVVLSDLEKRSPYWWEGPDGARVLMWYSNSYGHISAVFGMPPEVKNGVERLPAYLATYTNPDYKASRVMVFGAQWENSDLFPQQATLAGDWNKVYAYPHMQYSGFADALREIGDEVSNSMPVIKGDGGPYWEDGIYSDTGNAIIARRAEQRAPSAEKLATLGSLVHPWVQIAPAALRRLWQNLLLFDEHTWGAWQSTSSPLSEETVRQQTVKDAFAAQADQDVNYVMERGMAAISDYINDPKGTLVVFNTLNWPRSGLVETDLRKGSELVDLVDNKTVSLQVMADLPAYPTDPGDVGFERVRFLARDVPALGYRCYTIRPQSPAGAQGAKTESTLENAYYRVELDAESGAVRGIFDKGLNKELVNTASPYRFDQYLYVSGGDQPAVNRLVFGDSKLPAPELVIHGAEKGHLLGIERVPFGLIAHLESSDVNTPRVQTDIILFDAQKRIGFINRVEKQKIYTKEGVYFAFPFAADDPQVRYDLQDGVVDPTRDLLPGAAKEWFSAQHWISIQQGEATAALIPTDAELFTLGDIVRGKWPTELDEHRGTVFSYVMNNYWHTNYVAAQGGEFTFHYTFASGRNLAPEQLTRLGWAEMTPLESNEIIENDKEVSPPRPLDKGQASFLQVNPSHVILVNWKTAEDGHGTILRFVESAGEEGDVEVQIPILQIQAAWTCNAMEENQQPLATTGHGLTFPVKPFQIVTVRVEGAPAGQ